MKKILTLIMAAALALPTFAQFENTGKRNRFNHNNTEQYYGLRLGLNIAALSSDAVELDLGSRTGISVGAVYGIQLANSAPVWLETGLFYSEKGGKETVQGIKYSARLSYFQVPVVCKYAIDIADDFFLTPFFGGYMALGAFGKIKDYGLRTSESSWDTFNRFDAGLRLGCGFEYDMVYAEIGYDWGLTNISKSDFDATHTRNLFINVGVNF